MLSNLTLPHQNNDYHTAKKIVKPLSQGDISRLQAQRLSKLYFAKPAMWSHRLINVGWDIWPIQSPRKNFLETSLLYDFIFGRGLTNDINKVLINLGITTEIVDGFEKIVSVENIIITYHGYSTLKKNYTLDFYDEVINGFYPKSKQDILMLAKTIILIMNEVDPEELNYTNYGNLVHWYIQNMKGMKGMKDEMFGPLYNICDLI